MHRVFAAAPAAAPSAWQGCRRGGGRGRQHVPRELCRAAPGGPRRQGPRRDRHRAPPGRRGGEAAGRRGGATGAFGGAHGQLHRRGPRGPATGARPHARQRPRGGHAGRAPTPPPAFRGCLPGLGPPAAADGHSGAHAPRVWRVLPRPAAAGAPGAALLAARRLRGDPDRRPRGPRGRPVLRRLPGLVRELRPRARDSELCPSAELVPQRQAPIRLGLPWPADAHHSGGPAEALQLRLPGLRSGHPAASAARGEGHVAAGHVRGDEARGPADHCRRDGARHGPGEDRRGRAPREAGRGRGKAGRQPGHFRSRLRGCLRPLHVYQQLGDDCNGGADAPDHGRADCAANPGEVPRADPRLRRRLMLHHAPWLPDQHDGDGRWWLHLYGLHEVRCPCSSSALHLLHPPLLGLCIDERLKVMVMRALDLRRQACLT
mmetsp:Transcript_99628/g.282179  ORF Transcript_99628/g.282179 Transcript_99628/m.282179 type:complete len:432 (-) Transcript_99628:186-1481(-)